MLMYTVSRRSGQRRNVARSLRSIRSRTRSAAAAIATAVEPLERRMMMSAVTSGQTITASIAAKNEKDTYTINGVAGGTIMATIAETATNSALMPKIELHAPGGALLTYDYHAVGTTITSFNLAVSGTYSLVVSDLNATGTGGYALTA